MTKTAEQLLSHAMSLSESDRAELAAKLLDTLDAAADTGYARAWEEEIVSRLSELDDGAAKSIPWADARRVIRQGVDGEENAQTG